MSGCRSDHCRTARRMRVVLFLAGRDRKDVLEKPIGESPLSITRQPLVSPPNNSPTP